MPSGSEGLSLKDAWGVLGWRASRGLPLLRPCPTCQPKLYHSKEKAVEGLRMVRQRLDRLSLKHDSKK